MEREKKLLIIDDSAVVRTVLKERLSREKGIEVLGTAPDPYFARDKIIKLRPDVIILDIEMPRMDGLSFLKKIMEHHPLPVIIFSSHTPKGGDLAMEALALGAADVIPKPSEEFSIEEACRELADKIRGLGGIGFRDSVKAKGGSSPSGGVAPLTAIQTSRPEIIAIGASTGGVDALRRILSNMPSDSPGMVVVQHMPAKFTASFAGRLDSGCALEVKEARDGDPVGTGRVLIAPGDRHMLLRGSGQSYSVHLSDGPRVCYQRPAVDVLFRSVAACAGPKAFGIILTGMGSDGAEGLLEMRRAGAVTIAQDEESSVVFGMPKTAIELGAAAMIVGLEDIPRTVLGLMAPGLPSRKALNDRG